MSAEGLELVVAIAAALMGAAIWQARWSKAREDDKREAEIWSRAAERIKASMMGRHSLRVVLDGVEATMVREVDATGSAPRYTVRLTAGALHGMENVTLYASERMGIGGRPEQIVRAFFDAPMRLRAEKAGVELQIVDRMLVIEQEGRPRNDESLVALTRLAEALLQRWQELARAPVDVAEALGLVEITPTRRDGVDIVAKGLRRGREIELGVKWSTEAVHIVVFVGEARLDREGLAPDISELTASLDALLETDGAYR